jgi:RecA/RadA recombinase
MDPPPSPSVAESTAMTGLHQSGTFGAVDTVVVASVAASVPTASLAAALATIQVATMAATCPTLRLDCPSPRLA